MLGQRIWKFEIYFMSGQFYIEHQRNRIITLTQISPKLPKSIDSAFSDGKFVYLFKGNLQYRLEATKFPVSIANVANRVLWACLFINRKEPEERKNWHKDRKTKWLSNNYWPESLRRSQFIAYYFCLNLRSHWKLIHEIQESMESLNSSTFH